MSDYGVNLIAPHSKVTQNQGKQPFGPKFSSPAARSKGLCPESATLTVTIIPPDPPSKPWGEGE